MIKLDELKKELGPTPEELKQRWAEQCFERGELEPQCSFGYDPYQKLGFTKCTYILIGDILAAASEILQQPSDEIAKEDLKKLLVNDKFVAFINYQTKKHEWIREQFAETEEDHAKFQELSDKYDRDYDTLEAFL